MQLTIRNVLPSDKKTVLAFCKSTFSWVYYIHHVWDDWLDEGNFFVLCEDKQPVAICHGFIIDNAKLVWIEGIRVHPNYRQKGYAKKLVTKAENVAKKNGCKLSAMIIESKNFKSLKLAAKLHYTKHKIWNYYFLAPRKYRSANIQQLKSAKEISNFTDSEFYIRSWRWLPLDAKSISSLIKEKKIIISKDQNCIDSLGIIIESNNFEKTMMLTLLYATKSGIEKILPFIQNLTYEKKFKRIQILTKMGKLPAYSGLEKRLAFYHMTKNLD